MKRNYNNDLKIFHQELGKIEYDFPEFLNKGDLEKRCVIENLNINYNEADKTGYGKLSVEGTILPPEINNKIREVWNRYMQ